MKILILSPHRDDAALSLGLAVEGWLAEGHTVDVLNCFTRSEYAPFAPPSLFNSPDICEAVSTLRAREDQTWVRSYARGKRLGIVDLDFEDAPIRLICTPHDVCSLTPNDAPVERELSTSIAGVITDRDMEALVLPLALGNHIDHLTARNAVLSSNIHQTCPCAFYEDLPYASRPGVDQAIAGVARSLDLELSEAFTSKPTDQGVSVKKKRQFANVYLSQIEPSVAEDIAQFCVRYAGRERLWVNAQWQDSSLANGDLKTHTEFEL